MIADDKSIEPSSANHPPRPSSPPARATRSRNRCIVLRAARRHTARLCIANNYLTDISPATEPTHNPLSL